ncbi:MAG: glycosyltransferase [Prosthecobacter sp.]|uniref:glycosyltransferase family 2 protein n=1 Tax=Prosthecobacter sp. TaxID=1965333 RepID=UPI0025CE83B5|nr:glycosyltransferase family 2 protein [Prosthecobacter sp.]MCF7787338.1 glycosyltransferase [Prosthecobacter sp.]
MSQDALVSVIIPTFNRVELLLRALDSVLRQTVPVKEIWVIDDASTHPVEQAVRALAATSGAGWICYHRMEVNAGQGACRNSGMQLVSGEWVAFLDDDDWWLSNHVEELQKAGVDGTAAVIGLAEIRPEGSARGTKTWGPTSSQMQQAARMLFFINYVLPSASMFRRGPLLALGGIDAAPELRRAEDWDLALRGMQSGWLFACTNKITVIYTEPVRLTREKRHSTYLAVMHCLARHHDYPAASLQDRRLSLCHHAVKTVLDGQALGLPRFWAPLELARQSSHGSWQAAALALLAKAIAFSPVWLAALLLRILKQQAASLDAQITAVLSPQDPQPAGAPPASANRELLTPAP